LIARGPQSRNVLDADAVDAVGRDDVERVAQEPADSVPRGVLDQDAVGQVRPGIQSPDLLTCAADVGANLVVDDNIALRLAPLDVDAIIDVSRDDVPGAGRSLTDHLADVVVRGRDQDAITVVIEDVVPLDQVAGAHRSRQDDAGTTIALNDV